MFGIGKNREEKKTACCCGAQPEVLLGIKNSFVGREA